MNRLPDPETLTAARHNRLLSGLGQQELSTLIVGGSLVKLKHHQVLYRANTAIQVVYFPVNCVVSILIEAEEALAQTGELAAVEIALGGHPKTANEGQLKTGQ